MSNPPNARRAAAAALIAAAVACAACADAVAPRDRTAPRLRADAAPADSADTAAGQQTGQPAGRPTGLAARATIGPEGGTLASADGRLVVTVPEGAVARATTFAVQPIEGTARGGVGGGYRLSPHGTAFAKPVRLAFRYDSALVAGTAPALLRIASQDSAGRWWMARAVTLDTAAREVRVDAPHFSDWSLVAGAQILPHAATVTVDSLVDLRVQVCEADAPPVDADSLLAPLGYGCHDADPLSYTLADWSVNGVPGGGPAVGVVAGGARAQYVAPSRVPKANPVAVTVDWGTFDHPKEATLVANVTVVDAAEQCGYLRNVEEWDGRFGMSYGLQATKPKGRDYVSMHYYADVSSHLTKLSEGPNGITWQGDVTGVMRVDIRTVDYFGGETPYESTLAGAGGAIESPMMSEPSRVVLGVNLRDCTYTTSFVGSVAATLVSGDEDPVDAEAGVGSVRAGPRPVGGRTTIADAATVPARGTLWALANSGDAYLFATFMVDPIFGGYVAEDDAGAASASWRFVPSVVIPAPLSGRVAGVRTPAAAAAPR